MDTRQLLEHRRAKDEFFAQSHQSPLDHTAQRDFDGLDYYEPNPEFVFKLEVEPAAGDEIRVQTSDGHERVYQRAGLVSFDVDGVTAQLTLYDTGHTGYFIPFRDATSGKETYGAGRYLDIEPNHDGTVTIDFNQAYNPFCAYNETYSCPLPPIENWLPVAIEAGEKDFQTVS